MGQKLVPQIGHFWGTPFLAHFWTPFLVHVFVISSILSASYLTRSGPKNDPKMVKKRSFYDETFTSTRMHKHKNDMLLFHTKHDSFCTFLDKKVQKKVKKGLKMT